MDSQVEVRGIHPVPSVVGSRDPELSFPNLGLAALGRLAGSPVGRTVLEVYHVTLHDVVGEVW